MICVQVGLCHLQNPSTQPSVALHPYAAWDHTSEPASALASKNTCAPAHGQSILALHL